MRRPRTGPWKIQRKVRVLAGLRGRQQREVPEHVLRSSRGGWSKVKLYSLELFDGDHGELRHDADGAVGERPGGVGEVQERLYGVPGEARCDSGCTRGSRDERQPQKEALHHSIFYFQKNNSYFRHSSFEKNAAPWSYSYNQRHPLLSSSELIRLDTVSLIRNSTFFRKYS